MAGFIRRSGHALLVLAATAPAGAAADVEADAFAAGAPIERVLIQRQNIFDLTNPAENNVLYRAFNRLHIVTREKTVKKQLLFAEGDAYDPRLIAESERILRDNRYFYDAAVKPVPNAAGGVDVEVTTRDVWTLKPEFSISRGGGENKVMFGFEESNLLGRGQRVLLTRIDDVDRESTAFEYSDRHISSRWLSALLRVAENSDGHARRLIVAKPFHALDARRAAGIDLFDDERRTAFYVLGEEAAEYRHERTRVSVYGGWSAGLKKSWVRRWTAGFVYDDNRFSAALEPKLPQLIPADRKLVYPFIAIELLEDRFEKSTNHDQIERSEDFYMGTRMTASLGYASTALDADRASAIYGLAGTHSFGSLDDRALLLAATAHGRHERGDFANALLTFNARYYARQSDKRLFFALLDVARGHDLDFDDPVELGGDTGLRGYPLRYQTGESRALVSFEQRYFTDWYPWRLFRVGGAVFFDVGRTWGDNPAGGTDLGWLKDVGFGLRFAPTRLSTRKIIHLDIAFPLDGDPSIDSVQVLLEAKRSF